MRTGANLIISIALLTTVGGPLLLASLGWLRNSNKLQASSGNHAFFDWRLTIFSALTYTLAFNVVFFIQELFLVWPKALTPNLTATLFHNNHNWTGENPMASLFQGTGAAMILLIGMGALWWLTKRPPQTVAARLGLIWVAYQGLFQSLPQVVVGAFLPQNDVGMAMDYLQCSPWTIRLAALIALLAIVMAGVWLTRPLLSLSDQPSSPQSLHKPGWFIFQVATLPALLSILLILPFRMPGSIDQVVIVPVAVTYVGISWIQASAWCSPRLPVRVATGILPIRPILLALIVLLFFFQLILRSGVTF